MAKKTGVTNEKIMEVLLDMDERMATKDDLTSYATKNDIEKVKEDILEEIRPIAKAVDKDAEIVIDHGKRIVALERKTGIAVQ